MAETKPLPVKPLARAKLLEDVCINIATYFQGNCDEYEPLRREILADPTLRALAPEFIRACRDSWQFRTHAQGVGGYKLRREYIWKAFRPLLDHLEGDQAAPADNVVSVTLASFDAEGVHAIWAKALARRATDAEGAITLARTLLETVCKRVLDELGAAYDPKAELPKLYSAVAQQLNLSPAQHAEETFRAILGSCQQVVERLGSLRNEFGDAHGKGKRPVKPQARHAALAVNLAGTMATFLVETWEARSRKKAA